MQTSSFIALCFMFWVLFRGQMSQGGSYHTQLGPSPATTPTTPKTHKSDNKTNQQCWTMSKFFLFLIIDFCDQKLFWTKNDEHKIFGTLHFSDTIFLDSKFCWIRIALENEVWLWRWPNLFCYFVVACQSFLPTEHKEDLFLRCI